MNSHHQDDNSNTNLNSHEPITMDFEAKLTAEQLLDNALVTAGLLENSRSMLPRINEILEKLLDKHQ